MDEEVGPWKTCESWSGHPGFTGKKNAAEALGSDVDGVQIEVTNVEVLFYA